MVCKEGQPVIAGSRRFCCFSVCGIRYTVFGIVGIVGILLCSVFGIRYFCVFGFRCSVVRSVFSFNVNVKIVCDRMLNQAARSEI